MGWNNRIVEEKMVDPKSVIPNPKNFRLHPAEQQEAIDAVLREIGWIDAVTVSRQTNIVLNGHLRVEQAIEDGVELIPVRYVDVTPEEEGIILASFDRAGGMAKIDEARLGRLLQSMKPRTGAVQALADKQARQCDVLKAMKPGSEIPKSQKDASGRKVDEKVKTSVRVVVGHIQIFIPKDGFYNWLDSVKAEVGDSKEALIAEFTKRLELNAD